MGMDADDEGKPVYVVGDDGTAAETHHCLYLVVDLVVIGNQGMNEPRKALQLSALLLSWLFVGGYPPRIGVAHN